LITIEELRAKLAALGETRKTAQEELKALRNHAERIAKQAVRCAFPEGFTAVSGFSTPQACANFETYEVDLSNESEELLSVSPTGKVPVIVVDGDSIFESNVVNQYIDEVTGEPKLIPQDTERRAHARIWMAFADTDFFPALFVASVGR
jgi:hypothetical protein